jgi:adenosylcobinamide kinase / adenosylcobinamide-phosphate guanylyltransferase
VSHPIGTVLYLGGARSGKSSLAEQRLADRPATYVAPGPRFPDDPEWQHRLDIHRRRRPGHWRTLETTDVAGLIAGAAPGEALLVDCLTLWLTAVLDGVRAWEMPFEEALGAAAARIEALQAAVAGSSGPLVLVSNEVGSGIVPVTPSGRLFQDALGACNAAVAAACGEVNLVVAGLPIVLKGPVS